MQLKNKVAIITGSSANIGRAIAILFAKEGASVVVNARDNVEGGRSVVQEIEQLGKSATFYQGDVAKPEVAQGLIDHCLARFGRLDVLVNNAGRSVPAPFFDTTADHWLTMLESNLLSAVFTAQAAAKIMLSQKSGKIINTASIVGLEHIGRRQVIAYSAAKAGLINLTKTLALELAPHIQVNAVAPGFIASSRFETMPAAHRQEWIDQTLIRRWITPEELAETYIWLATSTVITGEVLVVDGGNNIKEIPY